MARKKSKSTPPPTTPSTLPSVTSERFSRLHRLVQLLGGGPIVRDRLIDQLGLDVRGFYRDLELLRTVGIGVTLTPQGYGLSTQVETALARLPYPDPHLSLGEMEQLARGRTNTHRKLAEQIEQLKS